VPGKGVHRQSLQGGFGDPWQRHAADTQQQCIDQCRYILAALPQCGHAQLDHIEPVIEILAETSGIHALAQVAVSCRDDAHIDRLFGRTANFAYPLFLDGTQQLDLHRQRQIGHLVKKERAAAGRLKETITITVRTGKGTLAITEEFAFHQ
ncbi:MAG: hypothetical protein QG638_2766, partial [Pseudomonadota bacterium]|nr:hypothetical protein [Pseudomonadota bacterium]